MPWLKVNRNATLTLAATLVDIPSSVIEDSQHRHNSVRMAVGALDVGA